MLVIRLTRRGRKNDPAFRLVVTEQSNPVKGKFLEELGFYNPKLKTKTFAKERILYWIGKGAKCSATVNNLFVSESIIQGPKVKAWRPKKKAAGEAAKAEAKGEKKPEEVPESAKEAAKEEKKEEVAEQLTEEKKEEKAEEKLGAAEPEKKQEIA